MVRQGGNKRKTARRKVRLTGSIQIDESSPLVPCVLWDVSEGGARLAAMRPNLVPDRFTLLFAQKSVRRSCKVVWRDPKYIGVKFLEE